MSEFNHAKKSMYSPWEVNPLGDATPGVFWIDADLSPEEWRQRGSSFVDAINARCIEDALSDPIFRAKFTFDGDPEPPQPPAIIKGMLPRRGIGLIAGQSGVGKTFLAVDLAVAAASGDAFFGKPVRTRVGVFVLALEGAWGFQGRVRAAKSIRGLSERLPIVFRSRPANLMDQKQRAELIKDLRVLNGCFQQMFGVPLGVIIIDTMSQAFAIENENDNAQVAVVCRFLAEIEAATEATTIGVHHYGKDLERGPRGASAYRANVDFILAATSERDSLGLHAERRLTQDKNRDGLEGLISGYDLKTFDLGIDEDGDPITTKVVSLEAWQPRDDVKKDKPGQKDKPGWLLKMNGREKAFAEAFNEIANTASVKHRVGKDGPEVIAVDAAAHREEFFRRYPGEHDTIKRAYNRAQKDLFAAGKYRCENSDARSLIWRVNP